jgi:hypothetical protein
VHTKFLVLQSPSAETLQYAPFDKLRTGIESVKILEAGKKAQARSERVRRNA